MAGEPVRLVDKGYALRLQVIRRVRVVHEHAQHVDGTVRLLTHPFGNPEGVDHPMAVPARRDLQDLHLASSLRGGLRR